MLPKSTREYYCVVEDLIETEEPWKKIAPAKLIIRSKLRQVAYEVTLALDGEVDLCRKIKRIECVTAKAPFKIDREKGDEKVTEVTLQHNLRRVMVTFKEATTINRIINQKAIEKVGYI